MPDYDSTPPPYTGPVPFVVHLHGQRSFEESDGHPEAWKLRCPIQRLRRHLVEDGVTAGELDGIDREVRTVVEESRKFAESSAWPIIRP